MSGVVCDPIESGMSVSLGRFLLGRIELIFFALLVVVAGSVWAYQALVAGPPQRCESSGNWWDAQTHTCGHVVYLPDLTHRRAGAPRYPTLPETAVQGSGGTSEVR